MRYAVYWTVPLRGTFSDSFWPACGLNCRAARRVATKRIFILLCVWSKQRYFFWRLVVLNDRTGAILQVYGGFEQGNPGSYHYYCIDKTNHKMRTLALVLVNFWLCGCITSAQGQ